MGNKIKPYLTDGCLDVHDLEDIKKTEEWIQKKSVRQYNPDMYQWDHVYQKESL